MAGNRSYHSIVDLACWIQACMNDNPFPLILNPPNPPILNPPNIVPICNKEEVLLLGGGARGFSIRGKGLLDLYPEVNMPKRSMWSRDIYLGPWGCMNLCHAFRGPKDHINIRISHSGKKAQYGGDTRNYGLWIFMFMYHIRYIICHILSLLNWVRGLVYGPHLVNCTYLGI